MCFVSLLGLFEEGETSSNLTFMVPYSGDEREGNDPYDFVYHDIDTATSFSIHTGIHNKFYFQIKLEPSNLNYSNKQGPNFPFPFFFFYLCKDTVEIWLRFLSFDISGYSFRLLNKLD
jgi:hypothetical protein